MMTSFQEMKASGKLLDSVLELISQSQEISKETRSCLEQVFTLTLPNDPEKRAGQMEDFVDLLCNPDYLEFVLSFFSSPFFIRKETPPKNT